MGHIVLEGPDGAGKTSLARTLVHALGMDYHHEGPPPAGVDPYSHYASVLDGLKRPTVLDRFHIGETIYGPLLRGGTSLTRAETWELSLRIIHGGGHIVVCLPPWEACLRANRSKKELITDVGMLREAYVAWVNLTRSDFRVYDYTKELVSAT